jgi:hypothetical protein
MWCGDDADVDDDDDDVDLPDDDGRAVGRMVLKESPDDFEDFARSCHALSKQQMEKRKPLLIGDQLIPGCR